MEAFLYNNSYYFYFSIRSHVKFYFEYNKTQSEWTIARRYKTYFNDVKYEIKEFNEYPEKNKLIVEIFNSSEMAYC